MTTVFQDALVEASDVELTGHTPDVGTGYTRVFQDGSGPTISVIAASDTAKSSTAANSAVGYTLDATYPSADYEYQWTHVNSAGFSTRPYFKCVRYQDNSNTYAVRCTNVANGFRLYKKVAGTWSPVGSAVTVATGSVCKIQIIGTTLKLFDDGAEVASGTVSDISAAGKAAFFSGGGGWGTDSGDDANSTTEVDNLLVTDLGSSTPAINKSEAISVTESVAADVSDPQVSASDTIGVGENKELLITSFVEVNDAINVGENSELLITSFVEVNDAIGVAESTAAEVSAPQVNASDTIGVAESVSLAVVDPGTTTVSVTDAISVAENVAVEVSAPQVNVNDTIGVAENNDLLVTSFVTVSEALALSDTPSLAVSAPQVNVSDGINVAESVSLDGLLPPPPAASGDGTIYFGQQAYRPDKAKEKRRRKLRREDEELLLLL